MNCRFLQTDSDFINHIKEKILEFKEIHENTSCNPNILWDAFKCLFQVIVWNIRPETRKKEMPPSLSLWMKFVNFRVKLQATQGTPLWMRNLLLWKLILTRLLILKQIALIIRSRCRWVQEGEKSSKYFCNLEKWTCERMKIHRLKNTNGTTIFDSDSILNEIHMFYKHLYSKHGDSKDCSSFLDNIVFPKLSDEKIQILDSPISKNELYTM